MYTRWGNLCLILCIVSAPWQIVFCGTVAGTPHFGPCEKRPPLVRICHSIFNHVILNFGLFHHSLTLQKFKSIGLEKFLKWQIWCKWVFSWIYCSWSCVAKKAAHKSPPCGTVPAGIAHQTISQGAFCRPMTNGSNSELTFFIDLRYLYTYTQRKGSMLLNLHKTMILQIKTCEPEISYLGSNIICVRRLKEKHIFFIY